MAADLRRRLDDGAAILVADGLAARQWEVWLARAQDPGAPAAWRSPRILPYGVWAEQLWAAYGSGALVLSRAQSLALWRTTIGASREAANLIGLEGPAEWAAEAQRTLRHWQLDPNTLQAGRAEPDFRAFLDWQRDYREQLHARGWIDDGELAVALPALGDVPPTTLILGDGLDLTPAQSALLARLVQGGSRVERREPGGGAAAARRIELADPGAELAAAAAWARQRLARAPAARLAVVVPDIAQRRLEVERIFKAALPEHAFWHRAATAGDEPLVGAALNAVELVTPRATFATLSRWLRSPLIAVDDLERAARALLERRLRAAPAAQLPFREAYRAAGLAGAIRRELPAAAAALDRALHEVDGLRNATPSRWTEAWQRAARALGWPPRAGTPSDDAALLQWDAALDALATLTPVLGAVPAEHALTELERIVQRAPAARVMPLAGVHVLAHVDEVGLGYDAAWVSGFTDSYWPQAARQNPLLPFALQQQHRLPWSSPQDARERSARSLSALFDRTAEAILSSPARAFDYAAEPSPAIRHLPPYVPDYDDRATVFADTRRLRETIEDAAPPLPGSTVVGGVAALDRQAECPLRAFCEHRLGAHALEPVATGLSARLQGIAAHRALELLYAAHPSSGELAHLAAATAELERCVAQALAETFGAARGSLAALYTLERERLIRTIREVLATDLQRNAFAVAAVEQKRTIELGQWSVRVRIDRLDTLADGGTAIIDYKTGEQASVADWFRDRLRDTQVPLYAAHAREPISAAVLGRLRAGATGYTGVWQTPGSFPGNGKKLPHERTWPAQLTEWRRQIGELVDEYAAGDLRVFTAEGALDAARGAYAPLTRVIEQMALLRGTLRPW